MDCRTFHKNLEDYLEGGLDFPGRFGVERHAQQCLGCGKDLADAQKLSRITRELSRAVAPPDFEAQVQRRIRSRGLHRRPNLWKLQHFWWDWGPARSLAWGTAALVLLIGTLFYSVSRGPLDPDKSVAPLEARRPLPEPVLADRAGRLPVGPREDVARIAPNPVSAQPHILQSQDAPFPLESDAPPWSIEPAGTDYAEYVVPAAGGQKLIMRLPRTIRMRHRQPSEEYFIRNVSH